MVANATAEIKARKIGPPKAPASCGAAVLPAGFWVEMTS
jgi:hypothetical protein